MPRKNISAEDRIYAVNLYLDVYSSCYGLHNDIQVSMFPVESLGK